MPTEISLTLDNLMVAVSILSAIILISFTFGFVFGKRRKQKEETYSMDFLDAIKHYLNFHPEHKSFETKLAEAVNKHAIPVGSGTVARTAMIPIEERAAKAVIAWMRHQTTAYEQTKVAHIKGERRALRRQFAQQSVRLLNKYRSGENIPELCPLKKALLKKI